MSDSSIVVRVVAIVVVISLLLLLDHIAVLRTWMRPVVIDPSSVVCYLSANMAQPIKMPFGLWSWIGPGSYLLDGNPAPPSQGAILRGERGGQL